MNEAATTKDVARALLVVERDFMSVHVGVRRVIFFYWKRLADAGYHVRLATPHDGQLMLAHPVRRETLMAQSHGASAAIPACWSSDDPIYRDHAPIAAPSGNYLSWSTEGTSATEHDISIITAPWLCSSALPDARYTAGIVYDMVPNLIACGALRFETAINAYEFAHAHDVGNRFFLNHCENIFPISDSTRRDFLEFYRIADSARVHKVVPFDLPAYRSYPFKRLKALAASTASRRRNVLLVNVLDPRKNFGAVAGALSLLNTKQDLSITIVGRERAMTLKHALSFLESLRSSGAAVEWYGNPGDEQLARFYQRADLLVFPSFYEGLGLPILEAQSYGVPAVSSNTSSCAEINMNKNLCVDASDYGALAEAIRGALERSSAQKRGKPLMAELASYLRTSSEIPLFH